MADSDLVNLVMYPSYKCDFALHTLHNVLCSWYFLW